MPRSHRSSHPSSFGSAVILSAAVTLAVKLLWGLVIPAVAAGSPQTGLPWSTAALIGLACGAVSYLVRHPRRLAHRASRHRDAASRA